MNFKLKRILLCAVAICLCLSLSGCVTLDSLRKTHAVYTDQMHSALTLNGETYCLLATNEYFNPPYIFDEGVVHATDQEIPLLWSRQYGDYLTLYANGTFLLNRKNVSVGCIAYCKQSVYEKIKEKFNKPFKSEFISFLGHNEQGITVLKKLTAEQQQAIYYTLQNTEAFDKVLEPDTTISLWEDTEEHLFRKELVYVYFVGQEIYLRSIDYSDTYAVPQEYKSVLLPLQDDYRN